MVETYPVPPDDVIEDIFARLPAKAVYRFRCLSRTWAARLVSDDFADLHLHLANRHGVPKMLFLQDPISRDGCGKAHVWSPDNPGGTAHMDFPPSLRVWEDSYMNHLTPCLVTQQCRGLVILCKFAGTWTYYVLNPSTGRMAMLPKSRAMARGRATRLSLGYDTRAKKHKVVCIYYCGSSEKDSRFNGCEVYVINSTKRNWRRTKGFGQKKLKGWINENEESVFAQRHLHWFVYRMLAFNSEEIFIFSFSLEDETSRIIALPPFKMERNHYSGHRLTELWGRLCPFCIETDNTVWPWAHHYNIWLLCRSDMCTWEFHCRIGVDTMPPKVNRLLSLVSIVDYGRHIIFVRSRERYSTSYLTEPSFMLCAYDTMTNDMENLLEDGCLMSNSDMVLKDAALYVESVASPGQPLTVTWATVNCMVAS
ncbi:hypothetical protein ACQ4PT_071620 [Festuca glaucescens]